MNVNLNRATYLFSMIICILILCIFAGSAAYIALGFGFYRTILPSYAIMAVDILSLLILIAVFCILFVKSINYFRKFIWIIFFILSFVTINLLPYIMQIPFPVAYAKSENGTTFMAGFSQPIGEHAIAIYKQTSGIIDYWERIPGRNITNIPLSTINNVKFLSANRPFYLIISVNDRYVDCINTFNRPDFCSPDLSDLPELERSKLVSDITQTHMGD